MDHDDMGPHQMDPHGLEPSEPDHGGLEPPEPDHGLDHTDPADHDWPDTTPAPAELGHVDDLHGADDLPGADDLDSADTAHLGFAEEYDHLFDDVTGGGLHTPVGYGDLPADLPDHPPDLLDAGEAPFGADPDLYPLSGADLGDDQPFPPTLELDPPEPIDGYPWADPSALGQDQLPPVDGLTGGTGDTGTAGLTGDDSAEPLGPEPAELFEYAGELPPAGGDAWAALLASDDPATSALARWWSS